MPDTATIKTNRDKLCAALRSGNYKQGKGTLRTTDNSYCCLGVAADILIKDGAPYEWDKKYLGGDYCIHLDERGFKKISAYLSLEDEQTPFSEAFGFKPEEEKSLAMQNDNVGTTFEDIAKAIEALPLP